MKFMVEFRIQPGNKNRAVEVFELRGPNRNPNVTFRGAWVGKHSDLAFVLVDSSDESQVTEAARSWSESGDFRVTEVIDVEQF
jgi:hypothetical protein